MDENSTICTSDIHSLNSNLHKPIEDEATCGEYKFQLYQSEIIFDMPNDVCNQEELHTSEICFDDDGDIVPERKYRRHLIKIDHCIETTVSFVGLQVWSAALLLSDYLIYIRKNLSGKCVLELGAGIGICSMISSLFAKQVFCTDVGEEVLVLCERNIKNFVRDFKHHFSLGVLEVKELNWFQERLSCSGESKFKWSEEEKGSIKDFSVFLASDVIYDNVLTKAFIKTMTALMEKCAPSCLLLSLEKRLNFTVDVLDVTSPHYDFFLKEIDDMNSEYNGQWSISNIGTDFPQYFHYERSKHLELWMLKCRKP